MPAQWTEPVTWEVDQLVSPDDLNEQVRDNLEFLKAAWDGYILIEDQKTQGTHGGTFSSGAWRTRDLNTVVNDVGGHVSLVSNQFTLDAGTYEILAFVPAYMVGRHQAILQNVTDAITTLVGMSAQAPQSTNVFSISVIQGRFTISVSKTFEIQHRSGVTQSSNGFGNAADFISEVYTQVWLRKVA